MTDLISALPDDARTLTVLLYDLRRTPPIVRSGFPHIAPAEQAGIEEFMKEIEKRTQNF